VIAGVVTAIGAILLAARLNSGSPNYGDGVELQAIAAAVVGGASLAGGRGRIVNTLIGALIIIVVQNGLNLNAVSTSMQNLTIGVIIVVAVGLDVWGRTIRERIRKSFRRSVPQVVPAGGQ
jgi:ribose transport system permease protein